MAFIKESNENYPNGVFFEVLSCVLGQFRLLINELMRFACFDPRLWLRG
jgi:hypothetical protein